MPGKVAPEPSKAASSIRIDTYLEEGGVLPTLPEDVRAGLTATPKTLPPKYFYDSRGSDLFEEITRTPEYYLTRTEMALLRKVAPALIERLQPRDLVELGPGSSTKTRTLLDALQSAGLLQRYVPVDVSAAMMRVAVQDLTTAYPELSIHGVVADFLHHLDKIPAAERRLVIFLGSTIGNLGPAEATEFLRAIGQILGPDDGFLLGADLVKEPSILEAAYNDAQGITAAFNRNILRVVNRNLDADFAPERFDHISFYNPDRERIESYLESREAQTVRNEKLDQSVPFAAGERIHTENSQKYTRESLVALLEAAGLKMVEFYTDERRWFSLSLAEKVT